MFFVNRALIRPLINQPPTNPAKTKYHLIKKKAVIALPKIDNNPIIFKMLLSEANIEPIGHPLWIAYFLYEMIVTPEV